MPGMRRVPKQSGFVRSLARTFRSHARLGFCLYGCLLLLCAPLHAIDRDRRLDQLHHTGWTYIEGAPGQVRALAQTTDGYLWLGTEIGRASCRERRKPSGVASACKKKGTGNIVTTK